jgi:polyphenol oxidase
MKVRIVSFLSILALVASLAAGQSCPPNIPIGDCTPKAGTPTNFAGDTGPMRTRKSIFALNAAEIAELRLAFQRLRALPASDPRAWLAQASVHCWYCAGDMSTIQPADDVHATWAFMPWHRDYLYMLEKILGQLVNDPKFALPYWDWNTAPSPSCTIGSPLQMPPPYVPKTVGTATNSLWDCYRKATASSSMDPARVGPAVVSRILTNNNTFDLFFGGPATAAALWPGPHGYIHLWVGNQPLLVPPVQDMGVLESASRDPLFWAHHANIDRLWDVWISQHGTPAYPSAFLAQNWTFWNENATSRLIRMTADDAANRATRLHYQYAAPSCTPTVAPLPLLAEAEEMISLTPQAQTITTETQETPRTFSIGASTGTHVVLHLDEITVPSDEAAILRVYVNKPGANAETDIGDSHMVEELFIVPSHTPGTVRGMAAHQHAFNIKVPLPPDVAAEVESAKGKAPVTVVPVAATPAGVLSATPPTVHVQMKKPYFTVE